MKSPIIATILLVLAAPAFAFTPTPAQEKDIHALYGASSGCLNYVENPGPGYEIPEPEKLRYKKACDLSVKLQKKLGKQGFCITSLHHPVGRYGKRYTQEEWERETGSTDPYDLAHDNGVRDPVPKNARHCDPLHDPAS